jgi:hypothetical protein
MKIFLCITLLLFVACSANPPQEKRVEMLVKVYLDSLNTNTKDYEILKYKNLQPIYNTVNDDPNYERYKNAPLKLDSIRVHFKAQITAWVIYVKFRGTDQFDNLGIHYSQCWIDKNLSKCLVILPSVER